MPCHTGFVDGVWRGKNVLKKLLFVKPFPRHDINGTKSYIHSFILLKQLSSSFEKKQTHESPFSKSDIYASITSQWWKKWQVFTPQPSNFLFFTAEMQLSVSPGDLHLICSVSATHYEAFRLILQVWWWDGIRNQRSMMLEETLVIVHGRWNFARRALCESWWTL